MTNQIKSLLMVFMLLFIGACAEADKSDGVNTSTSEFYLGEDLTIASIDGAVFTSDAVNPLEYNVNSTFSEEQDATALETAIATELENIVKEKLEANNGSEVTIGAYSISGMVSDTSKLTVTIPSTIATVDGEKTESYVFNVEFGGDVPVWDGTVTEPVAPIATASTVTGGVYEIYSPSELAWVIEMSSYHNFAGDTVVLKRNIDMNSLPITGLINFAGRFQGNRKEIRNLNISYESEDNIGFIRTMGSGGQIDNLTITGIIKGKDNVGGFIGQANGSVTVVDIKNYTNVIGNHYIGGIVGRAGIEEIAESDDTIDISRSINRGYVAGVSYTGGLIGSSYNIVKIDNSSNRGVINGGGYTGGFIGSSKLNSTLDISRSTNHGAVTGADNTGGFIGSSEEHTTIGISNSTNRGAVTGTTNTGGLIGYVYNYVTLDIDNSPNSGAVNGTNNTGGLLGYVYSYVTLDIDNSSNRGAINSNSHAGGLLGYVYYYVTLDIDNSSNSGAIKGTSHIGGFIGYTYYYITTDIDSSSNSGAITGTGSYIGGLIGAVGTYGALDIDSSSNRGVITGVGSIGGLIGYMYYVAIDIDNSSNSGAINATSDHTGGLIGYVQGKYANIDNSFNSGNIAGTKNVGGIVGYSDNGVYIKLKNVHSYAMKITGTTHYVGGFIGFYYGAMTVENSYWLHDAGKGFGTVKASGNIVPRGTYKKLSVGWYKKAANFKDWSFNSSTGAWKLTNKKFPTLRNLPVAP